MLSRRVLYHVRRCGAPVATPVHDQARPTLDATTFERLMSHWRAVAGGSLGNSLGARVAAENDGGAQKRARDERAVRRAATQRARLSETQLDEFRRFLFVAPYPPEVFMHLLVEVTYVAGIDTYLRLVLASPAAVGQRTWIDPAGRREFRRRVVRRVLAEDAEREIEADELEPFTNWFALMSDVMGLDGSTRNGTARTRFRSLIGDWIGSSFPGADEVVGSADAVIQRLAFIGRVMPLENVAFQSEVFRAAFVHNVTSVFTQEVVGGMKRYAANAIVTNVVYEQAGIGAMGNTRARLSKISTWRPGAVKAVRQFIAPHVLNATIVHRKDTPAYTISTLLALTLSSYQMASVVFDSYGYDFMVQRREYGALAHDELFANAIVRFDDERAVDAFATRWAPAYRVPEKPEFQMIMMRYSASVHNDEERARLMPVGNALFRRAMEVHFHNLKLVPLKTLLLAFSTSNAQDVIGAHSAARAESLATILETLNYTQEDMEDTGKGKFSAILDMQLRGLTRADGDFLHTLFVHFELLPEDFIHGKAGEDTWDALGVGLSSELDVPDTHPSVLRLLEVLHDDYDLWLDDFKRNTYVTPMLFNTGELVRFMHKYYGVTKNDVLSLIVEIHVRAFDSGLATLAEIYGVSRKDMSAKQRRKMIENALFELDYHRLKTLVKYFAFLPQDMRFLYSKRPEKWFDWTNPLVQDTAGTLRVLREKYAAPFVDASVEMQDAITKLVDRALVGEFVHGLPPLVLELGEHHGWRWAQLSSTLQSAFVDAARRDSALRATLVHALGAPDEAFAQ